jgi:hypothetical protein
MRSLLLIDLYLSLTSGSFCFIILTTLVTSPLVAVTLDAATAAATAFGSLFSFPGMISMAPTTGFAVEEEEE